MLIIYRGLGLLWGFLGAMLLPFAFLITGSAGFAFSTVAACWIYFGRGHFEPRWCQVLDSDGKRKPPAVFFVPVWVYGILVIPLALGGFFLDLFYEPRSEGSRPDGQFADADLTNSNDSDKERFERANHAITSSQKGSVHGNTEQARELATEYSGLMKGLSEAAFTGGGQGIVSMTDGEFLVYCQVNEGKSVALLVHVPQLRQYKDDVRDTLANLSWKAARTLLKATGIPDDVELAVALRGTLLYGPIMIDRLGNEATSNDRSKESLYPFFPAALNDLPESVQDAGSMSDEAPVTPPEVHMAGEPESVQEPSNVNSAMESPERPKSHINNESSTSFVATKADTGRFEIILHILQTGRNTKGNNKKARELAAEFSARLRQVLEEKRDIQEGHDLSTHVRDFRVWCQMNEGKSVAFLVYVPHLPQYSDEVSNKLSDLCWNAARTLLQTNGTPDDIELAVALRGVVLCGPVKIDRLAIAKTAQNRVEQDLYRFFFEPSYEIPATIQRGGIASAETPVSPNSSSNPVTSASPSQSSASTRSVTAGPDGPGIPVTTETALGPGQKLAGYWGREWSQVVVTGFKGEDVLTGWVYSTSWTSYRMSRSMLRMVSDEEYARCKVSYTDEPINYPPLADDMEIQAGQKLLCKIEQFWLPVEVTGPESEDGVPIHWTGFNTQFDDHVTRNRLALPNSIPTAPASRP